jgi:hypothetical protein
MSTQYEKFIIANQSLMECYAGVPATEYSAMSQWDQQQVCKNEAASVKEFFTAGQVDFKSILAERIAVLNAPKPVVAEE